MEDQPYLGEGDAGGGKVLAATCLRLISLVNMMVLTRYLMSAPDKLLSGVLSTLAHLAGGVGSAQGEAGGEGQTSTSKYGVETRYKGVEVLGLVKIFKFCSTEA